ncbi:MAG: PspC domain-containing protein [Chloroflexi bacterium]|nr:PspC domain-containing protein [Chloroflexota bacterium]
MTRKLQRGRTDKMIFGVCGGLANYFDVDPVIVRLAFVALAFLNGIGILAYIVLALVMPEETVQTRRPTALAEQDLRETGKLGSESESGPEAFLTDQERVERQDRGRDVLALILIGLGMVFLLGNLGFFRWVNFNLVWPLVLVAIGLLLIFGRIRRYLCAAK